MYLFNQPLIHLMYHHVRIIISFMSVTWTFYSITECLKESKLDLPNYWVYQANSSWQFTEYFHLILGIILWRKCFHHQFYIMNIIITVNINTPYSTSSLPPVCHTPPIFISLLFQLVSLRILNSASLSVALDWQFWSPGCTQLSAS